MVKIAAPGETGEITHAVAAVVRSLRDERRLTNVELIAGSTMSPAYYYQRINGSRAFGLMDLQRLAATLGIPWFDIFRIAAESLGDVTLDLQVVDRGKLAARVAELVETRRRADGTVFAWEDLAAACKPDGVTFSREDLDALLSGQGIAPVDTRKLRLLAKYWSIPDRYLTDPHNPDVADLVTPMLDLRDLTAEIGAQPIPTQTVSEMTPEAIRTVIRTLRALTS